MKKRQLFDIVAVLAALLLVRWLAYRDQPIQVGDIDLDVSGFLAVALPVAHLIVALLVMVVPERDDPGIRAKTCAKPTIKASWTPI